MNKKKENLIVVREENLLNEGFPITFDGIIVQRTKANEAKYRHLTTLIVGVYTSEDNKIMVLNKYQKNKTKDSGKYFPSICRDVPGGHSVYDDIPASELQSGELSMETVRAQAFKEWSEEVIFTEAAANPFCETDLVFVGFYPYESETNKEFSALFALPIRFPYGSFHTQDNVGEVICSLPNDAISYEDLLSEWETRHENTDRLRFEDGLARVLKKGDLPQRIKELQLSENGKPISIL